MCDKKLLLYRKLTGRSDRNLYLISVFMIIFYHSFEWQYEPAASFSRMLYEGDVISLFSVTACVKGPGCLQEQVIKEKANKLVLHFGLWDLPGNDSSHGTFIHSDTCTKSRGCGEFHSLVCGCESYHWRCKFNKNRSTLPCPNLPSLLHLHHYHYSGFFMCVLNSSLSITLSNSNHVKASDSITTKPNA